MPYRGKPIAEGGFVPSQIGTGEAQVFQPLDTSFLEKAVLQEKELGLAREKMAAAQQQAQAKAQAKSDLEKEKKLDKQFKQLDQEYEGLFPKSKEEIHDMAVGTWDWLTENADDPNVDMELFKRISSINQLTSTLKDEREQVKEWEKMKAEGVKFENWELLDQFDTDEFWADMATDPAAFGVKLAEIMTKVKPKVEFDVITLAQKTAMKGKAGAPITSSFVDEYGIVNYTKTPDLKTWRNNLDLVADEQWKNTDRLQEEYPADTKGGVGNSTWRELVWVNRPDATYSDSRRNPPEATGKTGWQGKYGATEKGYNLTPTEKGFVNESGDKFTVIDWELSQPGKQTDDHIVDLNIAGKQVKADIYAFRKRGDKWSVLYTYKGLDPEKTYASKETTITEEVPLENVKGKIEGKLLLTEEILNSWDKQRLSGGSTAPRTTGGTSR